MERWLTARLKGEPDEHFTDGQGLRAHLESCESCREVYGAMGFIHRAGSDGDKKMAAEMAKINWEENAVMISSAARMGHFARQRQARFRPFAWKFAVPALAGIFILGVSLGYLLFHGGVPSSSSPAAPMLTPPPNGEASLVHLENTLARRELQDYFRKSHLLITDLMRRCDSERLSSPESQLNRKQIRFLLNKQKLFSPDLETPQLQSVQPVLKKIEWVLLEMLTLEEDFNCEKLGKLQEYIRKEQLLFKLRLVGKDIGYNEV